MPVVAFLSLAARLLGSPAGMMLGVGLAALSIYQYGKHTGYANCRIEWMVANAAADLEKKKLEARLAVLERIVTDRGIQTAEQIDALLERQPTRIES